MDPNKLSEDGPRKPRIIVSNLNANTPSQDNAIQNPELNIDVQDASNIITPLFQRGKREAPTINRVCEVASSYYQMLINKKIYNGFYSCRILSFEEITQ